jgi:hypothetical protein
MRAIYMPSSDRKPEIRTMDLVKITFDKWKKKPSDYLLPCLESYLITLVASIASLLILGLVFVAILIAVVIGVSSSGSAALSFFIVLGAIILLGILVYLIAMMFISAIVTGGLNAVICGNLKEEPYKFGDVWRKGRLRLKTYLALALFSLLLSMITMAIILIPMIFILAMGLSSGAFFFIWMIYWFIIMIPLMLVNGILINFIEMPYVVAVTDNKDAGDSIKRGVGFVYDNLGQMTAMGILYQFAVFILSMVPFVGALAGIFGPCFLYTGYQHYYRLKTAKIRRPEPEQADNQRFE